VCHDFKGGYHPYETPSYPSLLPFHTNTSEKAQYKDGAYRLSQWAMVDGFIYFAHSLVSLPPPQWVSAAHVSGAKAIGTFITEWGEGHDKCKALFQDKHSAEKAALQLARMAVYHRLEGWLINIENKIDWAGGTTTPLL
jgi:mannosyl-glycoprotein endo-beta-N-acetylglucosaminidase